MNFRMFLWVMLFPQFVLAFDSSNFGNTLPTLEQLQCYADTKPALNSQSNKLEPQNAFLFGILSGLAYYKSADATPIATTLGFSVKQLEGLKDKVDESNSSNLIISHTVGLWLENSTDVVIAIGGTNPNNVRNFITDSQFIPLPFDSFGKVHGGFLNALNIIWPQLKELIRKMHESGHEKNIHLTGHSLGASIATLAAIKILGPEIKYQHLRNLYTFGSPHVGLKDFVDSFNKLFEEKRQNAVPNNFRFVHQWDVVTRILETEKRLREKSKETAKLDFDKWGIGSVLPDYKHVGHFVYFNGDGKLFEEKNADDAFSFFGDPTAGITNHDIRFYTEYSYRLWKNKANSTCLD
jgi:hypothetical protein